MRPSRITATLSDILIALSRTCRDVQRGRVAVALYPAESACISSPERNVECADRFVGEDHVRVHQQRSAQCDPLLFAAGELMRIRSANQRRVPVPSVLNALSALRLCNTTSGQPVADVLRDAQWGNGEVLKHHARRSLAGGSVRHDCPVSSTCPESGVSEASKIRSVVSYRTIRSRRSEINFPCSTVSEISRRQALSKVLPRPWKQTRSLRQPPSLPGSTSQSY